MLTLLSVSQKVIPHCPQKNKLLKRSDHLLEYIPWVLISSVPGAEVDTGNLT